jgi:hypothetical protein
VSSLPHIRHLLLLHIQKTAKTPTLFHSKHTQTHSDTQNTASTFASHSKLCYFILNQLFFICLLFGRSECTSGNQCAFFRSTSTVVCRRHCRRSSCYCPTLSLLLFLLLFESHSISPVTVTFFLSSLAQLPQPTHSKICARPSCRTTSRSHQQYL